MMVMMFCSVLYLFSTIHSFYVSAAEQGAYTSYIYTNRCIDREGNGTPLQCSCLENPMDGGPGGLPSMGSHRVGHD